MNVPRPDQFTPYSPTQQELAVACAEFNAVYKNTEGGAYLGGGPNEESFGRMLADERLLVEAISQDLEGVPELTGEGEIWQLHKQRRDLGIAAVEKCVTCPLFDSCAGVITLKHEAGAKKSYEENRRSLQTNISQAVSRQLDGSVLKGGFAMALHGIDRETTDLDFDVFTPLSAAKKHRLETIVIRAGGKPEAKKDTDTTVRYTVPLETDDEGKLQPLKLEFRTVKASPEAIADTTVINGIRVYTPEKLLEQKANAFLGRSKARDSIDLSYLVSHFPDAIKTVDTTVLEQLSQRLRPDNGPGNTSKVELGPLEAAENIGSFPRWINRDVALRMMTELSDKVDEELMGRSISAQST